MSKLADLPLGYSVEYEPITHYACYYDEVGCPVYWYIRDTDGARAEVWRHYHERRARAIDQTQLNETKQKARGGDT